MLKCVGKCVRMSSLGHTYDIVYLASSFPSWPQKSNQTRPNKRQCRRYPCQEGKKKPWRKFSCPHFSFDVNLPISRHGWPVAQHGRTEARSDPWHLLIKCVLVVIKCVIVVIKCVLVVIKCVLVVLIKCVRRVSKGCVRKATHGTSPSRPAKMMGSIAPSISGKDTCKATWMGWRPNSEFCHSWKDWKTKGTAHT